MFAIKEGDTQYVGDGYYYKTISGGEMNTYIFYSSVDDREIYRFDVIYPLSLDS